MGTHIHISADTMGLLENVTEKMKRAKKKDAQKSRSARERAEDRSRRANPDGPDSSRSPSQQARERQNTAVPPDRSGMRDPPSRPPRDAPGPDTSGPEDRRGGRDGPQGGLDQPRGVDGTGGDRPAREPASFDQEPRRDTLMTSNRPPENDRGGSRSERFESQLDEDIRGSPEDRFGGQKNMRGAVDATDLPPDPDYNMDLPERGRNDGRELHSVKEELHQLTEQNERIIDLLRQIKNGLRQR